MAGPQTDTHTRTRTETLLAPRWRVIVHNDPVNLMGYVVLVFRRVLGMNRETAERHMLEVHRDGKSVVWIGPRETAEHHVHELQAWQLRTTLEPDDAQV